MCQGPLQIGIYGRDLKPSVAAGRPPRSFKNPACRFVYFFDASTLRRRFRCGNFGPQHAVPLKDPANTNHRRSFPSSWSAPSTFSISLVRMSMIRAWPRSRSQLLFISCSAGEPVMEQSEAKQRDRARRSLQLVDASRSIDLAKSVAQFMTKSAPHTSLIARDSQR
jgi:hypothetical protein